MQGRLQLLCTRSHQACSPHSCVTAVLRVLVWLDCAAGVFVSLYTQGHDLLLQRVCWAAAHAPATVAVLHWHHGALRAKAHAQLQELRVCPEMVGSVLRGLLMGCVCSVFRVGCFSTQGCHAPGLDSLWPRETVGCGLYKCMWVLAVQMHAAGRVQYAGCQTARTAR